jgi:membrane-associated protease RseP (regulator of RpoE activity)
MNLLVGALIFLPFITVIISIHELGHLLTAKHFGMKCREYFVGFGPRIWSTRRGETEYGAKWVLLGGYVKIEGMNPYETVSPEDLPRTYGAKPIWQRAWTIFAGPGSHFVVAAIIFAFGLFVFGDPRTAPVVIDTVEPTLNGGTSPAREAGLQQGDVILAVDGIQNPSNTELVDAMTTQATDDPGGSVTLVVGRNGQPVELSVAPELAEGQAGETIGRVGVTIGYGDPGQVGLVGSVVGGVKLVGDSIRESFTQIGRVFGPQGVGRVFSLVFTDEQRQVTDATSVVGISQQVGATSSQGDWGTIFYLFGFVTVFIGLINLVPLPPFDGGHLMVLAIEKVRGKAVDMRKLVPISATVMGFFVLFVTATVFLDFTKPIAP